MIFKNLNKYTNKVFGNWSQKPKPSVLKKHMTVYIFYRIPQSAASFIS